MALGAFGCVLIGSAAAVLYAYLAREDTPLLAWDDLAVVARGQALYEAHCAGCHGANGEGQTAAKGAAPSATPAPPHDSSGHTWQHPDFALIQLTKTGKSTVVCQTLDATAMPKFGLVLTDREILDILSYIKSTWPTEIRAEHERINALYKSYNAAMRSLLDLPES
jgi:mono/diheme cytochrome c family protein